MQPTEDKELQRTIYDYIEKCADNWDKYFSNPNLPDIISFDEATTNILEKFERLGYHKK